MGTKSLIVFLVVVIMALSNGDEECKEETDANCKRCDAELEFYNQCTDFCIRRCDKDWNLITRPTRATPAPTEPPPTPLANLGSSEHNEPLTNCITDPQENQPLSNVGLGGLRLPYDPDPFDEGKKTSTDCKRSEPKKKKKKPKKSSRRRTSGRNCPNPPGYKPCLSIGEATKRVKNCCIINKVSGGCMKYCSMAFTAQSLRQGFMDPACPNTNLGKMLGCATLKVDHTPCCRKFGVSAKCQIFCNAGQKGLPALDLSYALDCEKHVAQLQKCFHAGADTPDFPRPR